jgi:hypothetical protein
MRETEKVIATRDNGIVNRPFRVQAILVNTLTAALRARDFESFLRRLFIAGKTILVSIWSKTKLITRDSTRVIYTATSCAVFL